MGFMETSLNIALWILKLNNLTKKGLKKLYEKYVYLCSCVVNIHNLLYKALCWKLCLNC